MGDRYTARDASGSVFERPQDGVVDGMTAAEMIAQLQQLDPNLPVRIWTPQYGALDIASVKSLSYPGENRLGRPRKAPDAWIEIRPQSLV